MAIACTSPALATRPILTSEVSTWRIGANTAKPTGAGILASAQPARAGISEATLRVGFPTFNFSHPERPLRE